jgi:hypothetical protein
MLMMHAPNTWLSASLGIDDQSAILNGDQAVQFHDAGFDVDGNVGHLNAGRALRDESFARSVRLTFSPISSMRLVPSFCTGRLPREALVGIALHVDAAVRCLELIGVVPSAGATVSNSLSSALTVDLRVEALTPPTVVDPPEAPETGY